MTNDRVNKVIITEDEIIFNGFSSLEPTTTISVFHTENSFTIYPFVREGIFYTSFDIIDKTIKRVTDTHGYALFRTMIENIKEYPTKEIKEYQFVEINDVFMILV